MNNGELSTEKTRTRCPCAATTAMQRQRCRRLYRLRSRSCCILIYSLVLRISGTPLTNCCSRYGGIATETGSRNLLNTPGRTGASVCLGVCDTVLKVTKHNARVAILAVLDDVAFANNRLATTQGLSSQSGRVCTKVFCKKAHTHTSNTHAVKIELSRFCVEASTHRAASGVVCVFACAFVGTCVGNTCFAYAYIVEPFGKLRTRRTHWPPPSIGRSACALGSVDLSFNAHEWNRIHSDCTIFVVADYTLKLYKAVSDYHKCIPHLFAHRMAHKRDAMICNAYTPTHNANKSTRTHTHTPNIGG